MLATTFRCGSDWGCDLCNGWWRNTCGCMRCLNLPQSLSGLLNEGIHGHKRCGWHKGQCGGCWRRDLSYLWLGLWLLLCKVLPTGSFAICCSMFLRTTIKAFLKPFKGDMECGLLHAAPYLQPLGDRKYLHVLPFPPPLAPAPPEGFPLPPSHLKHRKPEPWAHHLSSA